MNAPNSVTLPRGVVTVTSRAPSPPAGVVKDRDVALDTTMFLAAAPPTRTDVVPVRFVPVKVTRVPPAVGPDAGLRVVIVGAGT